MAKESGRIEKPGLKEYIEAGYPCLFLPTVEPEVAMERILKAIEGAGEIRKKSTSSLQFGVWKATTGLHLTTVANGASLLRSSLRPSEAQSEELIDSLGYVLTQKDPVLLVFHNIREYLKSLQVVQQLIDCVLLGRLRGSVIFLVGAYLEVPPELRSLITFVDCPLPTRDQIHGQCLSLIQAYEDEMELPDSKEERESLIRQASVAAVGLDSMGAENAFALSLATTRGLSVRVIQMQKEQEVKKSDVLEFVDVDVNLDHVGGFSAFKEWLRRRKRVFTDEARDFGLPFPKGVLLVGVGGCLTGDTKICLQREGRNGGRGETLESLYYRFNGKHSEGVRKGVVSRYKRLWNIGRPKKTLSYQDDSGYIRYNKIEGVIYSGTKIVYRVETFDGFSINATEDHKFLTPDKKYVSLRDLKAGDKIVTYLKGELIESRSTGRNKNIPLFQINNVGNHPKCRRRLVGSLEYTSHPLHRLVVEAHMNKMPLEKFLARLHGDVRKLKFLSEKVEVHHIDNDRRNNELSNLAVLTKAEHAWQHWKEQGNPDYRQKGRFQIIKSIDKVGERPTFDIRMKAPYNNFVANGFVVHNSGKSLCAKATANYLKLPCLRMDIGRVARSLYGESLHGDSEIYFCETAKGESVKRMTIRDAYLSKQRGYTFSCTDFGGFTVSKVLDIIRHKRREHFLKIVTKRGYSVIVTEGHSLFVRDSKKFGNSYPYLGDKSLPPMSGKLLPVKASTLKVGDRIALNRHICLSRNDSKRVKELSVFGFEGKVTVPIAELIGLWLADGSRNRASLRISSSIDEPEIGKFLDQFGNVTPCRKEGGKGIDFTINNYGLFALFCSLGVSGSSQLARTKRVPAWIFGCSNEVVAAVLRGYFSGDGSFSGSTLEVTSRSEKLIIDIAGLLRRFSIVPYIIPKWEKGAWSYRLTVQKQLELGIFSEKIGFMIDKKNRALKKALSRATFHRYSRKKARYSVLWDEIEEIIPIDDCDEFSYDLSVEGTQKFMSNWIVVHNSEQAIRLALQVVEAVAPIVLWIDEIDKAFAGMASSGNLDSGVTSRVIQTYLTWRQETKAPVFVAATANEVSNLPSMVYRKGRFDEVWATALPDSKEREEIFSIHIKKRERKGNGLILKKFDLQALAAATADSTGAEIESYIEDAMFYAFDRGKEVTQDLILRSVGESVPQAKRDREEVARIEDWVKTRARLVSGKDIEESQKIGFNPGGRTMKVKRKEVN